MSDSPGRRVRSDGYVDVWKPGHALANASGYVTEHRYVVDEAGVTVPAGHHVHHINHEKQDNRLENLRVLSAHEHGSHHARDQAASTDNPALDDDTGVQVETRFAAIPDWVLFNDRLSDRAVRLYGILQFGVRP